MANSPGIKSRLVAYYCVIITCINSAGIGVAIADGVVAARRSSSSALSIYTLSDILDDLDLHSDNRIRPGYGERTLEVHAFAFIRNIIEINEADSTITLNLLFMQMWEDARTSFSPVFINNGGATVKEILIDNPEFMSRLWNPDTFIVNEVRAHVCTGGNNLAHQVIRLSHTGSILKTSRLTVTVSCPMQHKNYPFHSFECDIELESFGHKTDDITFMWRNGSRSVDYSKIDTKSLAGKSSYELLSVESHSQQSYLDTGGSYSKLIIRLHFSKLWLRHSITFFIPTVVLTIISLSTLWILKDASTGVITNFIIAGLVILLAGVEYSVATLLTQVPFLTPVDVHLGICLCAIFSSVTFHGVALCLTSECCGGRPSLFKNSKYFFKPTLRKKRQPETDDAGVETDMEKFLTARDSISKEPAGKEVSYYESYDEALEGEAAADDEGEERNRIGLQRKLKQRARADVLEGEGHHDKTPVASSNFEGGSNNGKMSSQRKKTMQRFFSGLVSSSLTLSKWITLCSFVLTESIFWYGYLGPD